MSERLGKSGGGTNRPKPDLRIHMKSDCWDRLLEDRNPLSLSHRLVTVFRIESQSHCLRECLCDCLITGLYPLKDLRHFYRWNLILWRSAHVVTILSRLLPCHHLFPCAIDIGSSFDSAAWDNYHNSRIKEEWRPFLHYQQLKLQSDGKICAAYTSICLGTFTRCLACHVIVPTWRTGRRVNKLGIDDNCHWDYMRIMLESETKTDGPVRVFGASELTTEKQNFDYPQNTILYLKIGQYSCRI